MNVYSIKIGKYTKKGNFQPLVENVIMTDLGSFEARNALKKQYAGFDVVLEEVEVLKFTSPSRVEKNQGTSVVNVRSEYGAPTEEYSASIDTSDIEEWKDWTERMRQLESEIATEKHLIEQKVREKFALKSVKDFSFSSHGGRLSFKYYSHWFDFKGALPLNPISK